MVLEVVEGGAGEVAGLKRYDVITAVAGQSVEDGDKLVHAISLRPPGSEVDLSVFRDGRVLTLRARLSERTADKGRGGDTLHPGAEEHKGGDVLGLVVGGLSGAMQSELGVAPDRVGVVVRDVKGLSPGVEQLARGDLIVELNRRPTPDLLAYRRALQGLKAGEPAWLLVHRPRPRGLFLAKVEVERE